MTRTKRTLETRGAPSAGFTLIEVAISTVLLVVLSGALVAVLQSLRMTTTTGSIESGLSEAGERALMRIMADLRRSAFVVQGASYPFLFDDGFAGGAFAGHAHPPADEHAQPGEPDFGVNREIVFLQPADQDTFGPPFVAGTPDGLPDLDPAGLLSWAGPEFSYVLITGADGINRLERRIDGGQARNVASFVERIVFDDSVIDPVVAINSIRVRLWLRRVDAEGFVHRWQGEVVVRLRNTLVQ